MKGIQAEKVAGAKRWEGLWEMGNRWCGWPEATQRGVCVKWCRSVVPPVKEEVRTEIESGQLYLFRAC